MLFRSGQIDAKHPRLSWAKFHAEEYKTSLAPCGMNLERAHRISNESHETDPDDERGPIRNNR